MSFFLKNKHVLGVLLVAGLSVAAFFVHAQVVVAPSNIVGTAINSCQIDLTWTLGTYPVTHIRSKGITVTSLCSMTGTLMSTTTLSSITSLSDTRVFPGTKYCYWMRSCADPYLSVCSAWSNAGPAGVVASTTTPIIPTPSVATFTLAIARDGGTRMDLYWQASRFSDPANAYYNIYRDSVLYASSVPAFAGVVPITTYQDIAASPSTAHSYQIQASQGANSCGYTARRNSALSLAIIVPVIPSGVTATYTPTSTEGGIGPLEVAWTDGAGPSEQRITIWRKAYNEANFTRRTDVPVGTQLYIEDPASLVLDSSYEYQLRSCVSILTPYMRTGCSDLTDPPVSVAVANGPQDVQARLYYVNNDTEEAHILLSFENTFADLNYSIERSNNNGSTWANIDTIGTYPETVKEVFYRDTTLPLGNYYKYRVRADLFGGEFSDSVESGTVNTRISKIFYGNAYSSIGPGYTYTMPSTPSPTPTWFPGKNSVSITKGIIARAEAAFAPAVPLPTPPPIPAVLPPIPTSEGGAGWISFNSSYPRNSSPVNKYSVQADQDGILSGVAWASLSSEPTGGDSYRYGWLSFNKADLYGCPGQLPTVPCTGRLDEATGKMTGWARFIGFKDLTGADQWTDGWVSLSSFGAGIVYGSSYSSSLEQIIGTAWNAFRNNSFSLGLSGIGWIGMGQQVCADTGYYCHVGAMTRTNNAIVRNVSVSVIGDPMAIYATNTVTGVYEIREFWETSPFCASSTFYSVLWQYEGINPSQTTPDSIELIFSPTGATGRIVTLTAGSISGFQFVGSTNYPVGDSAGTLSYGTEYVASVRAFDGINWSEWATSSSFTTPTHYPPLVTFDASFDGTTIAGEYKYSFDGTLALDRSGGTFPTSGWAWDWVFANGTTIGVTPATASGSVVDEVRFPDDGIYPTKLTVDDGSGTISCSYTDQWISSSTLGSEVTNRRRIWIEP